MFRFRAQAELNVAAKLPLDDSGDVDSLISVSTANGGSLSRHNSNSDVRKISPDLALQRSNSNDVSIPPHYQLQNNPNSNSQCNQNYFSPRGHQVCQEPPAPLDQAPERAPDKTQQLISNQSLDQPLI